MIKRYSRPEMTAVWSPKRRWEWVLEIEILAAEAMAEMGTIPKEAAKDIRQKAAFDMERVAQIESITHHDVIAFLTAVSENVGENGRFLHQGMTSSDVLDTAFSLQWKEALTLILEGIKGLLTALETQARQHKHTVCMGRSHGIHAEPTTFGLKLLSHFNVLRRHKHRIENALNEISVAAISGPVGTFASVDPRVEAFVAKALGLRVEGVSTQIIPRDRHATVFLSLANLAAGVNGLAVELRHLQRTEVSEAFEPFGKGQKGSSAMPHKRNPVLLENVCGLCRLISATTAPALENVASWHERDISHSSV